MSNRGIEIECPGCGGDSLLRREPVYEGFRRIGERLSCASCDHVFADETTVPFKKKPAPRVFGEADKSAPVRIFDEDDKPAPARVFDQGENERLCRYCIHYTVNPFVQRCARFMKEVEATDTCGAFAPKEDKNPDAS